MTFEEMQQQWKTQDAKLDAIVSFNTTNAVDSALDRVRRWIWLELLFGIAALLMLGSFEAAHLREPRYLATAIVLHLCALALVGACAWQLIAARRVDYADPVLDVQRRLNALKISRIRTTQWTLLLSPALWLPIVLVMLKGFLGIDGYALFDARWIAANVLFGLAFIPLMLWLARRYGPRLSRSPLVRSLVDDLAGRSLNEAAAFAERLARFEE
jgi:hypothetical protein